MKRSLPLALAAALACSSGSSSSSITITSDDGRAVLEIPDGALPEGVSASDISITTVPEGERPTVETTSNGTTAEEEVLAAYQLEPSGTEFQTPVTLRIALDEAADEAVSYLAFLESERSGLTQPDVELVIDIESGRLTSAAVELDHFSRLVYIRSRVFYAFRWQPPPMDTESQVEVGVVATLNLNGTFCYGDLPGKYLPATRGCYTVDSPPYTALVEIFAGGPISPTEVELLEETMEDVVAVRQTFNCLETGTFDMQSRIFAFIDDAPFQTFDDEGNVVEEFTAELKAWGRLSRDTHECLGAVGGESCDHAHECGAGRLCGDGQCKDDSGSIPCSSDADCAATAGTRPVCEPVTVQKQSANMRCADCRDNSQCSGVRDICVNNHCVDCDVDADCPSNICTPAKTCGECRENGDCPGAGTCVEGFCQACASDDDCTGVLGVCGADGECVQCASDSDCSAPLDRCRRGFCNSCVNDGDCPSLALPSCNNSGCSPCDGDFDCDGSYTCESAGLRNACTLSCNGDGDCGAGRKCISGRCAQCNSNADCPASAPICGPDGHCFECDGANPCDDGRVCRVSTGNCVHCLDDGDCTVPGLPTCNFNACAAQ
jgi:hypothetical protein